MNNPNPANTDPFPVSTRVFFLEGGKTRLATVEGIQHMEGLGFVIMKLDDAEPNTKSVMLPFSSVNKVTR